MNRELLFFCLLLIPGLISGQQKPEAKEVAPELWASDIPEIPEKVAQRIRQYQNTRSAIFESWIGDRILIRTRFGETSQMHLLDRPMGARRQLTFEKEPVSGAASGSWKKSPGFFYSKDVGGSEAYQIFHFGLKTGIHERVTDGISRNTAKLVSPDKQWLLYSSTKRNGKDFDVYLQDTKTGNPARMVYEASGWWGAEDWSPDGKEVLLHHYKSRNESYYFRLNLERGTAEPLVPKGETKVAFGAARYAADGSGVYLISDQWGEFRSLGFVDLETGNFTNLTPDIRWDVRSLDVDPKGKFLAFTVNEDGIAKLHVWKLPGRKKIKLKNIPEGLIYGLAFNDAGTKLALTMESATGPEDVFSLDLRKRRLTRWTHSEVGGLDTSGFVAPSLVRYRTFDETEGKPREIPAFFFRPKGNGPFPVVVYIHGGPESQYTPWFSSTFQYWIQELGIAVLAPNVRGSFGYGKSYLLLDNGFKREDSVKDIGALLDWIKTRPELDAKRIGVYGGSYGGYMVLASMARFNDRIKAGIEIVGISNFVTFLKNTKEYRRDLRRVEYGDERDPNMRAHLESISPTNIVGDIKAPLFVAQGANDPRVPASEAEQIVEAVRASGKPVWYLLAKDEGHGFRKKKNKDFYRSAVSLFWEKHLLGP